MRFQDAERLSTEAGWNQTAADWARIERLCGPQGCFGIRVGGRLVASTASLVYDEGLAWLGMVLTAKDHRGNGYAGRLVREALDWLDSRRVRCVKLDATDLGRPVYSKLGFVDERPVSRWVRPPAAWSGPSGPAEDGAWDLALDREAFGADRGALLESLNADGELYSAGEKGFAFGRPGRIAWHFGPCVARDSATARQLLSRFLRRHGQEPTLLDLCDEHASAAAVAEEAGFAPVRRLMRMFRGADIGQASGPLIYALAGFEFG